MALREHAPKRYLGIPDATKAQILCDALAKVTFLDDFGSVGDPPDDAVDREAGRALVEVGRTALPLLANLLGNRSEAPISGSDSATIAWANQYRRCDFAYRYILLILGRKHALHPDLAERDRLIADLQKELAGWKHTQ